jgi:hypothetical protein
MSNNQITAEPRLEAPEPSETRADCGHEIYNGEMVYADADGRTFCEQCVRDRAANLDARALARALGYTAEWVSV